MMKLKAALLAAFTVVMLVAVLAVARFVYNNPAVGPVGWILLAAGIGALAIPWILIIRVRGER